MKNTFCLFLLLFSLISCGVKVPYTNELRDEFSLDSDEKMRNVQFSTSHTIILDQELILDSQNTTQNGAIVYELHIPCGLGIFCKVLYFSFRVPPGCFVPQLALLTRQTS